MKTGRYIFGIALCVLMLAASALGVSRKPKSGGDNKTKATDTVKQSQPAQDSVKKAVLPSLPTQKDSSATKKITPAKFNDFQDQNKNGIDDRLEKSTTETKKPSVTATKKTEPKKSGTITKTPTSSKKSK